MSEKLSNLLDAKVSQSDLDDFLLECKNNPELIERWQRYHIAHDMVKNEISEADLKFDMADKVMAEIAADPNKPIVSEKVEQQSNVVQFPEGSAKVAKKPWIPMAIAASMLLGLYVYMQQPAQQTSVENLVAESTDVEVKPADSMPHWQTNNAAVEDALNALLVEHSEFTSVTGMNGLGSYSKFVSY